MHEHTRSGPSGKFPWAPAEVSVPGGGYMASPNSTTHSLVLYLLGPPTLPYSAKPLAKTTLSLTNKNNILYRTSHTILPFLILYFCEFSVCVYTPHCWHIFLVLCLFSFCFVSSILISCFYFLIYIIIIIIIIIFRCLCVSNEKKRVWLVEDLGGVGEIFILKRFLN